MLVLCVKVWNTLASHCLASSQLHSIDMYKYSYIYFYINMLIMLEKCVVESLLIH